MVSEVPTHVLCVLHIAKFKAGTNLPANTGKTIINKNDVTNNVHTYNGNVCQLFPGLFIFITVVIIFIPPNIELIPAKCKANIAKSTDPPECDCKPANGG
ncbi:hypothetical protein BB560_000018 [Smittium megazygosporum]|uniref:Uncharacterized protein n=1 Tax=Smittium megazygosporum TaxID=133381 RepID=A0A2T9ZLG7_9FUNG|nr:hypothetical protein BB560_000018 [Smittium megazygosporum]